MSFEYYILEQIMRGFPSHLQELGYHRLLGEMVSFQKKISKEVVRKESFL
jgi:hypothetical protein